MIPSYFKIKILALRRIYAVLGSKGLRLYEFNPLVTDPPYLVSVAKIFILKREGIIERISYERRAYESVDDRSHS